MHVMGKIVQKQLNKNPLTGTGVKKEAKRREKLTKNPIAIMWVLLDLIFSIDC